MCSISQPNRWFPFFCLRSHIQLSLLSLLHLQWSISIALVSLTPFTAMVPSYPLIPTGRSSVAILLCRVSLVLDPILVHPTSVHGSPSATFNNSCFKFSISEILFLIVDLLPLLLTAWSEKLRCLCRSRHDEETTRRLCCGLFLWGRRHWWIPFA